MTKETLEKILEKNKRIYSKRIKEGVILWQPTVWS